MKIHVDNFLKVVNLNGATSKEPIEAIILEVKLIPKEELNFPSDEDRYELTLQLGEDVLTWIPNKTTLRALSANFGDESENWENKTIKLYSVSQMVAGKEKQVIYGVA